SQYNLYEVLIYRKTDDGSGGIGPAELLVKKILTQGQTQVVLDWAADADGKIEEDYFVFIDTIAWPFPYFGELEVAAIGFGGFGECTYKETTSDNVVTYRKYCINDTTGQEIEMEHSIGKNFNTLTSDGIVMAIYQNNNLQNSTRWINASTYFGTRRCDVTASGWVVTFNFGGTSFSFSGCSWGWPCDYNNPYPNNCWPDYSTWSGTCGTYTCPPLGSIQPSIPFPGDCHDWWDHEDEDGAMVRCNY
ncbi:MAG: hypothetical protein HKO91_12085, partial [Desulfobacterales bacterium]|nr:hypothetical protein [Desulfobacterales bacterium]